MSTCIQAREAGQQKKKWLLVNLQDSSEFASQVLNRDVWSNHNVKDIIKQHFLFLQVGVYNVLPIDGVTFGTQRVITPQDAAKIVGVNNVM